MLIMVQGVHTMSKFSKTFGIIGAATAAIIAFSGTAEAVKRHNWVDGQTLDRDNLQQRAYRFLSLRR